MKNDKIPIPVVIILFLTVLTIGLFLVKGDSQPGLAIKAKLDYPTDSGNLSGGGKNLDNGDTVNGNFNSQTRGPSPGPTPTPANEKVIVMGGSSFHGFYNDEWISSGDLSTWSLFLPKTSGFTPSNRWPPTNSFCTFYFKGKIFLVEPWLNVWTSSDGISWTKVTSSLPHTSYLNFECTVFNNEIWISGGYVNGANTPSNEVWHTPDGVNWTQAIPVGTTWLPRTNHTFEAFQNKLWIMGGVDSTSTAFNDVWSSPDGINWTQSTASASWPARYSHTSVVFQNKLWVIGGFNHQSLMTLNDVWSSPDGINWTQATNSAPWFQRMYHESIVYNGKMWVLGGSIVPVPYLANDVWSSPDGINWTQSTNSAGWDPRFGHSIVVVPASYGSDKRPDLKITNINFHAADLHQSTTNPNIRFTATLMNDSYASVTLPPTTHEIYYLDQTSGSYVKTGTTNLSSVTLSPYSTTIVPGTSSLAGTTNLRATLGTKPMKMVTDTTNVVSETNENNNSYVTSIMIVP